MSKPLVSVIVPIKNNVHIHRLKKDLSVQTFKNFELIVMDSDESVSVKRNKGVKKAKGELIVFVDDDVIIPKKWLEQLVKNAKIEIPTVGVVTNTWKFGKQEHATTCNCIFYKSKFKYFNETFKYAAYEDKDWFYRMGGVDVISSAPLYHFDQHKNSIKKNFIFGMESVKLDKMWENKTDHRALISIVNDVRVCIGSIFQILGVFFGVIKYKIFRWGL